MTALTRIAFAVLLAGPCHRTTPSMRPALLRIAAVAGAAVWLGGCASAATTPGSRYHLTEPQPWGATTAQWLTGCNPNPDVGQVTCNAILTGSSTDREAWFFEARIRVVSNLGIPYGREPRDFFVAGTQAHCDVVRLALRSKPHTFYAEETPPTDPCRGPFYFKLEAPDATG